MDEVRIERVNKRHGLYLRHQVRIRSEIVLKIAASLGAGIPAIEYQIKPLGPEFSCPVELEQQADLKVSELPALTRLEIRAAISLVVFLAEPVNGGANLAGIGKVGHS